MKKQQRTADVVFIRDLVNEVRDHQNFMRHALICNDLAAFLQRLSLSDKCLTTLLDMLNKEIERLKKAKNHKVTNNESLDKSSTKFERYLVLSLVLQQSLSHSSS